MNLINPLGLLGLLAIPVIIGLHMHRDRSRQVVVSSLNLWSFLDVQLRGAKSRQIRVTWLLVLDLLIAVLFSLALARPEITLPFFMDQNVHTILFLDDSTSMLAGEADFSNFELAKDEIRDLLEDAKSGDIVTLLTFGGEVNFVGDTREMSKQELSYMIEKLSAGHVGMDLQSAMALGQSFASEKISTEIHIYSDGAFSDPGFTNLAYPVHWHFYGSSVDNQAITSLRVAKGANRNYQIYAKFANYSQLSVTRDVILLADSIEIKRIPIILESQSEISQIWNLSGQPKSITIALSGTDILPEDDTASFGMHLEGIARVALVTDEPEPVNKAILSINNVDLHLFKPSEYISGFDFDLVVFRGFCPAAWPSGNVLVLDPPIGSDLLSITGTSEIASPITSELADLFSGVDFSGVRWGSVLEAAEWQDQFTMLAWSGETPLVLMGEIGLSDVVAFLPVLADGNIVNHPAFPIFISNVVTASTGFNFPNQIQTGDEVQLPSIDEYPNITVTDPFDEVIPFSQFDGGAFEGTKPPGVYQVEITDLRGISEIYSIGVNAGSADESNLAPREWVTNIQPDSMDDNNNENQIVDLSPWLLGIALVFILLEVVRAWR